MVDNFHKFYQAANIVLGTVAGALIAIPFAFSEQSFRWPFLIFGIGLGAMSGYRRRKSQAFLYLSIFVVATVSTLIYFKIISNEF